MVFSSTFFLFGFLPITLLIYYLSPNLLKNTILLIASLIFYAWGEALYVALMLFSIGLNYTLGLAIENTQRSTLKRHLLIIAIVGNLALLGFFKYGNFIVDNVNVLLHLIGITALELEPIHLPLGISFFTFQAMSYVIDVYRNRASAQKNPLNIALYIALFPQLIAGPIIRYHDVMQQLHARQHNANLLLSGVRRFSLGLAKKMLIANPLGLVADEIFALPSGNLAADVAWLGVLCYSLQIYFDFSGYSDMAIGLGRMFGFRFLENFNYPYMATSIQDFWKRWHISLSSWFRDYLYIPLGGNRRSPVRVYFNLLTVFLLCGLWHGASWNFVIWGMIHGGFLTVERMGVSNLLNRMWPPFKHLYTLLIVMVAWVFFRAETTPAALNYLATMFGMAAETVTNKQLIHHLRPEIIITLGTGLIFTSPIYQYLSRYSIALGKKSPAYYIFIHLLIFVPLCAVSFSYVAAGTYNPFIYFRF